MGCSGGSERGVGLKEDIVFLSPSEKLRLSTAKVKLDLVDNRLDDGLTKIKIVRGRFVLDHGFFTTHLLEQFLGSSNGEVRDTDVAYFATLDKGLHRPPSGEDIDLQSEV